MYLFSFKQFAIKKMMKMIHPHPTAYFITYEDHLRLCWYQLGKVKSTTIPYSQPDLMLKAATILKDCGIIDGHSEDATILFCYKYRVHKDAAGRQMIASFKDIVEWSDLSLTKQDVRAFAAHFAFTSGTEKMNVPKESNTPVFPLTPRNTNSNKPVKRTA
jgi:hypothetical protein